MKRPFFAAATLIAFAAFVGCNSSTPTTPVAPNIELVIANDAPQATPEAGTPSLPVGPATEPTEGFALISPLRSMEIYLLNLDREVVHRWKSDHTPAGTAYLMENGDLLRGARDPDFSHFEGGGIGLMVERYSWDGELLWRFRYANKDHCFHHDIATMPNGNLLMIAWERKSKEEAIAQGRDPELLEDDLWPDHVIEVQPDGPTGGRIVWEWHMWDHMVQDFDREKPNFGVIYEHPELIDLNNTGSTPPSTPEELRKLRSIGYTGGGDDDGDSNEGKSDWMHTNAIHYNPELDQITLSAKNFSEVWIIDHSTTTEEAASHRGGKSGKGGDLLYRWGNPWSYKSGTIKDKMLFDQHDVRWIPPGFPGAGHITAFNNGRGRDYSTVIEIETPMDEDGEYILDDEGRFGPYELAWEYTAETKEDFYSVFISGATRLPNGNTFICEGATGRFFEVNSEGKTLWEHVNTFGGELDREGRANDVEKEARRIVEANGGTKSFVENNALFRATKYRRDYAGLVSRTLAPLAEQPVPFESLVAKAVATMRAESAEQAATESTAAEETESEAETEEANEAEAPDTSEKAPQVEEPEGAANADTNENNRETRERNEKQ
jgi:hypothetical protein